MERLQVILQTREQSLRGILSQTQFAQERFLASIKLRADYGLLSPSSNLTCHHRMFLCILILNPSSQLSSPNKRLKSKGCTIMTD
jgi:hypothetical protein